MKNNTSLSRNAKYRKFFVAVILIVCCLSSIFHPKTTYAQIPENQKKLFQKGIFYYDDESPSSCGATTGVAPLPGIPGEDVVLRFLRALAATESGGQSGVENPTSSAAGKFQYITSTWKSVTSTYYPPASVYPRGSSAPVEMQDAVAYLEYTQKFKNEQGNIFRLAISHYYPAALSNDRLLDIVPRGGNVYTPRQYGTLIVDRYNKGQGANIVFRHLEAPDFNRYLNEKGGFYVGGVVGANPTTVAGAPSPVGESCTPSVSAIPDANLNIIKKPVFTGNTMSQVKGVVLHWTAGSPNASVDQFIAAIRSNRACSGGCSVQFYIDGGGRVYQLVDNIATITSHASGVNSSAVGIEIGGASEGMLTANAVQSAAVAALVKYLVQTYNFPAEDRTPEKTGIMSHHITDRQPWGGNNGKTDVGDNYHRLIINTVKQRLGGQ